MNFDKSLLSGSTRLLVLSVLERKDEYGWGIIQQLKERSESDGMISSYEQDASAGRTRKYYHITDKGHRELARQKEQWEAFSGGVNRVIGQGAFA